MTLFFRLLSEFKPEDAQSNVHKIVDAAFYENKQAQPSIAQAYQDWEALYRRCLLSEPALHAQRKSMMNSVNPAYVPRNYLAQQAIDAAEAGDIHVFTKLLNVLEQPYHQQLSADAYAGSKRPEWAVNKAGCSMLSCSS